MPSSVEHLLQGFVKGLLEAVIYQQCPVDQLVDLKIGYSDGVTLEVLYPWLGDSDESDDDFQVGFRISYDEEAIGCQVFIEGDGPNPYVLLKEIEKKDALIESLQLQLTKLQEQMSKTDRMMVSSPSLPMTARRDDIARTSRTSIRQLAFVEKANPFKDVVFISRKNSCDDLISRPTSKQIQLRHTPSIPELATPRAESTKSDEGSLRTLHDTFETSTMKQETQETQEAKKVQQQSHGDLGLLDLFESLSYESFDLPILFKSGDLKELKPKKPDKPKPKTRLAPRPRILRRKIVTRQKKSPKSSKSPERVRETSERPKEGTERTKETSRSKGRKSLPPVKHPVTKDNPQQQQGPPPPIAASCILSDEELKMPLRRTIYTADRPSRVIKRPRPPPKSHTMVQMRRTKPRTEVIDDLIYSREYSDADKWRKVLETLRDQPKLLSKMLEPAGKYTPIRQELSDSLMKTDNPQAKAQAMYYPPSSKPPIKLALPTLNPPSSLNSSGKGSLNHPTTLSSDPNSSSMKEDSFERPQSITVDWSDSVLNSYVSAGFIDFNWENDPNIFTEEEVRELLKVFLKKEFDIEEHDLLFRRAVATLERVSFELVLDTQFDYKITQTGFLQLLRDLKKLLETRSLTAVILKKIHHREELIELTDRECTSIDKELLALIASWKKAVPYGDLLYEGVSYAEKIKSRQTRPGLA
mmetsp:Transcript_6586/g.11582  ORF Transcript_6586/g.11582 Transcript_6586/m.11582 type:complete len:698 (+) Transcript_6586:1-2094(+)